MKSRVAYVPDAVAFYPWMSVRETLDYSGLVPSRGGTRRLNAALLDRFRLDTRQKASHLSKGQRTQLALIGAICAEPEVLILDEPTSGLDPIIRREFVEAVIGAFQDGEAGRSHRLRLDTPHRRVRGTHRRVHHHRRRPRRADARGRCGTRAATRGSTRGLRQSRPASICRERRRSAGAGASSRWWRAPIRIGPARPPAGARARGSGRRAAHPRGNRGLHAAIWSSRRMTPRPSLKPAVVKELRASWPVLAAALTAMFASPVLAGGQFRGAGILAYTVGAASLGAIAFGHEFSSGTMQSLLALPRSRRSTASIKLAVLAGLPSGARARRSSRHFPGARRRRA